MRSAQRRALAVTRSARWLAGANLRCRTIAPTLLKALLRGDALMEFLHKPEANTKQHEDDDCRQQGLFRPNVFFLRVRIGRVECGLVGRQGAAARAIALRLAAHCAAVRSAVTIGCAPLISAGLLRDASETR